MDLFYSCVIIAQYIRSKFPRSEDKFLEIYSPFYESANTLHEVIPDLNVVAFAFIVIGQYECGKRLSRLYDNFF